MMCLTKEGTICLLLRKLHRLWGSECHLVPAKQCDASCAMMHAVPCCAVMCHTVPCCAVLMIDSLEELQAAVGFVPQDEDEPFSPSKHKAGSRKRKARSATQEAECEDRDHWEECSACQHWVNLGKGREGLHGVCEQCGGEVRWREHEQVQSWIQCDACGRWRTVPDTVLRQVLIQTY